MPLPISNVLSLGPAQPIAQGADKLRREAILDLSKYVNGCIRVKFTGGTVYAQLTSQRTVTGILKGYDQLLNLVLDEVTEELQRMLYLVSTLQIMARTHY